MNTYDTITFGFFGITSATPFTSATFFSQNVDSTFNIPEIEFAVAAVPEPATWADDDPRLHGLGLMAYRRQTHHVAFDLTAARRKA